jgi:hypothetical protein
MEGEKKTLRYEGLAAAAETFRLVRKRSVVTPPRYAAYGFRDALVGLRGERG